MSRTAFRGWRYRLGARHVSGSTAGPFIVEQIGNDDSDWHFPRWWSLPDRWRVALYRSWYRRLREAASKETT